MQALVSLLPEPYFQAVEDIWNDLDKRFGCRHAYERPKPHFTWQYAESYDDTYAQTLEGLCSGLSAVEVQTDIVTRFSESDPVVFLRIVPTLELLNVHRILWEGLRPFWNKPSMLYQPGEWVPHITLSMNGERWCDSAAVCDFLSTKDLQWSFKVEKLTMLSLSDENTWGGERDFFFY
ncbi:MAG: 2'-5' RNA ligase family protein [Anaerolineaceae bacterium]|jgi:2'-5' RNA ligase|nr:2'-5' RNA ligase family protein [Anaerolineaceae bacterium]MDD4042594.1 2'-5' RNA ligase family protein [Anaerolineaceae bacterium]MDD4577221.1 2'-5' RNA ligase family protein [Anaerolineaceae bacterium]